MANVQSFKKALVTGASSGIGQALAHLFADQGIDLILHGRNEERLTAVARELQDKVNVEWITADLVDRTERQKLVQFIQQQVPDLVVNNAGLGLYGDVLTHATERWLELHELDTTALLELSIEAARSLVNAKKKGVILNVSSIAAFQPVPSMAVYAAAKEYVLMFSEGFDAEVRSHGVRVLCTCPGVVQTRFQGRAAVEVDAVQKRYAMMTPDFAARDMWHQIQTGQVTRVFDWRYRVACFFSKHINPRWLTNWIMKRAFSSQYKDRPILPPNTLPNQEES